jgi:hypothetical protein
MKRPKLLEFPSAFGLSHRSNFMITSQTPYQLPAAKDPASGPYDMTSDLDQT